MGIGAAVAGIGAVQAQELTQIHDWHDLNAIRNNLDSGYELSADLHYATSGYDEHVADPKAGWEPIGEIDNAFTGTFDGRGYAISDLTINRPDEGLVGLFGLAGSESMTITNVRIESANIEGRNAVGGLIGVNGGEVTNSSVDGEVTGDTWVGGLAGMAEGGIIRRSSANGVVTGKVGIGGLVGGAAEYADNEVMSSWARTEVAGDEMVGTLVGAWSEGKLASSWASGTVTGEVRVGGLVGQLGWDELWDDAILRDSYWNTETTSQTDAVGVTEQDQGTTELRGDVTGLTTDQMHANAAEQHLSALDFENTWQAVSEPDSYPILQWQHPEAVIEDNTDPATDDEGESLDATEDGIPGFGIGSAVAGITGVAYLMKRRVGSKLTRN